MTNHLIKFLNYWSLEQVKLAQVASEPHKCPKNYLRIDRRTGTADTLAVKKDAILSQEVIWEKLIAAVMDSIVQSGSEMNMVDLLS